MAIKGIIFDFNGTLLWDTPVHNLAWDRFLQNHKISLTDQEKNERIHGKNNRDILRGLFEREIPENESDQFIDEKESLYREMVIEQELQLAPGATGLFDKLKEKQIIFTIATASGIDNVRFYFERYHLSRWFDFGQVVYDDGTLRGKPNPDFFERAMQRLNLNPEECVVFEDSYAGIKAAENAKAGKIIIVNSTGADYSSFPHQCIGHFGEFDLEIPGNH
jgi:HAD superfamily hydrolase (TIGR01509 family)